jgi:hypothetical protein
MILNYTRFHPITCLLLDSGKRIETLSNFLQFSLGHRWTRTVHLSFRTWWSWRPPTRNSARKLPKSWKMCWKWVRFHYFQLGNLPNECNYRRLFFFPIFVSCSQRAQLSICFSRVVVVEGGCTHLRNGGVNPNQSRYVYDPGDVRITYSGDRFRRPRYVVIERVLCGSDAHSITF